MLWHRSHKAIAGELNISRATVSYRQHRIKTELGANTLDDMWEVVYTCGLVHLLGLPLGPEETFLNYEKLLSLDPSATSPIRVLK